MNRDKKIIKIAVLLLTAVLSILAIYGIYMLVNNIVKLVAYEHSDAVIVTCEHTNKKRIGFGGFKGKGGRSVYQPVAQLSNGEKVVGQVHFSRKECRKGIGSSVSVLINPDDAADSYINSFTQLWITPLAATFAPLLVIGVFMLPILWAVKRI